MDQMFRVVAQEPNVPDPAAEGPDAETYNTFEVTEVEISDFSHCVHPPMGLIRRIFVEGHPDATFVTDTGLTIPTGKPEKADPGVVDTLNAAHVNILGGSMDEPGREPTDEEAKAMERREVVSLGGLTLKVMRPDLLADSPSFQVCFEMLDGPTKTRTAYTHAYHFDHCKHPTHYLHLKFDRAGVRARVRKPVGGSVEFETAEDVYVVLDDSFFGDVFKGIADVELRGVDVSTLNLSRFSGITVVTEGAALTELRSGHYRTRYAGGTPKYV